MKLTVYPNYGQVIPTCKKKGASFTFTNSINYIKFYCQSF